MMNLFQILRDSADSTPDRPYLYGGTRKAVSYSEAAGKSAALAEALRSSGRFSQQPVLAAVVEDGEQLVSLVWACLAAGICLAFLPKNRHLGQTRLLMRQVGADALVSDVAELEALSLRLPADMPEPVRAAEPESVTADRPAFLFQTSGTTGEAKWVQVAHGQFLRAIQGLDRAGGLDHAVEQTVYLTPPLSHSYGLSSLLEYTFAGSSIALPGGGSPLGAVGDLCDPQLARRVTAIEGVPFFYTQLAKLCGRIQLPELRHIGTGGGAAMPTVFERLRRTYPVQTCSVRYGMTETPSVVSQKIFIGNHGEYWSSSGRVLPLYDLRIADEAGRPLAAGQVGEIHVQGDCLAMPYPGEPDRGSNFFATGDLGYLDADQELHVVGRKSVYLKNRGFRVSPEYVEAAAVLHEEVHDCQALNDDGGLLLRVVPNGGAVSASDLLGFLAERLPGYALPDQVQWVEEVERTGSGKIRRYSAGRIQPAAP